MTATPEIPIKTPESVVGADQNGEISREIEQGQPMIQQQPTVMPRPTTTATNVTQQSNQATTVTVPADSAQLTALSKGNSVNAITWFANFWLRIIKKALTAGSSIMTKQSIKIPVNSLNVVQDQTNAQQVIQVTQGQNSSAIDDQNMNPQNTNSDLPNT